MGETKTASKKRLPSKVALNIIASNKVNLPKYKIDISVGHYDHGFSISYNGREVFSWDFELDNTDLSCGVKQLFTLPENEAFRDIVRVIPNKEERDAILQEAFLALIEECKTNEDQEDLAVFILISNNTEATSSRVNEILDACFTSTESRKNPNSGNQIKIWIA